jgi:hypothetical protein
MHDVLVFEQRYTRELLKIKSSIGNRCRRRSQAWGPSGSEDCGKLRSVWGVVLFLWALGHCVSVLSVLELLKNMYPTTARGHYRAEPHVLYRRTVIVEQQHVCNESRLLRSSKLDMSYFGHLTSWCTHRMIFRKSPAIIFTAMGNERAARASSLSTPWQSRCQHRVLGKLVDVRQA